jgi:hypothetical protein
LNGVFVVEGTKTYTQSPANKKKAVPHLVAVDVKKAEQVLDREEVKNWVKAEINYVAAASKQFVGRWRIVKETDGSSSYITLTKSFGGQKSIRPTATANWEIVGDEARITFSDGWLDILRPQKDRVLCIAFKPGTSWNDAPDQTMRAIKEK